MYQIDIISLTGKVNCKQVNRSQKQRNLLRKKLFPPQGSNDKLIPDSIDRKIILSFTAGLAQTILILKWLRISYTFPTVIKYLKNISKCRKDWQIKISCSDFDNIPVENFKDRIHLKCTQKMYIKCTIKKNKRTKVNKGWHMAWKIVFFA